MAALKLRAGPLDLLYQNGFIRYIRLGDEEIIRMINHALRDHDWGTIPMEIIHEDIQREEESFRIDYQASFRKDDISFDLHCKIEGKSDGSLHFHYHGEAKSNFKKNRIGFTVLHPVTECIGRKVTIAHPAGNKTVSVFPKWISPHQPFKDIKSMHWQLESGTKASLFFEGELFETEDQRNWTDASYKTYCTPLGLPFPVEIKKGEEIRQYIQLQVVPGILNEAVQKKEKPVSFHIFDETFPLVKMGSVLNQLKKDSYPATKELNLDYLRVDFDLDAPFENPLRMLEKTGQWNIPVELALFTDGEKTYEQLQSHADYFAHVKKLLLFGGSTKTTPDHLIEEIPEWKKLVPAAKIYAGTDAFFTELNRQPVNDAMLDGITYSINPQVHAFDDASLVENLEAQGYTVETSRHLFPDKKINISPVSYHMRWNPNATDPSKSLRQPTGWSDPRIHRFFGACWFLISLKYLSEYRADAVTYFELEGDNGWYKEGVLSSHPMFELRKELAQYHSLKPCQSDRPLEVDGVCLLNEKKRTLFLVNWTDTTQEVGLPHGYYPEKYCQESSKDDKPLEWKQQHTNSLPAKSICVFRT